MGWVSKIFIVKFEFPVPKLVTVPIFSSIASLFNFEGWGVGVVKGKVSEFFIIIFLFSILKLVSVPIFSSIASLFNFEG